MKKSVSSDDEPAATKIGILAKNRA